MAREQNFYYQNPGAAIGESLGRALFGDPEMAAKQRQMQAEAALREAQRQEAEAHGGLYRSQASGQTIQNNAAAGLPELIRNLAVPAPAPIPSINSPDFLDGAGPTPPPIDPNVQFRNGLPAVIAAMAQMQGDKIDPRQSVGTLASFLGGDEMARRGLVAQGHSPEANFAITSQRADEISARDASEAQTQAFGVARINHATDIPVENIKRQSAFDVAGIKAASRSRAERNNNPGMPPAAKPPKAVSTANVDQIDKRLSDYLTDHFISLSPATRASVLSKAVANFQQSGNAVDAVQKATSRLVVNGQPAISRDANGEDLNAPKEPGVWDRAMSYLRSGAKPAAPAPQVRADHNW